MAKSSPEAPGRDDPAAAGPPLPPDVAMAIVSLRVILKSVQQSFARVQDNTGISGSQLWCLAAVAREPGIRVTRLAQALGVRQATVSKLVEVLVRKRLLQRERGQRDQRVVMLQLSPAGRQALQRAPVPATGALPQALLRLPGDHLQQLNGLLAELRVALDDDPAQARLLAPTPGPH